MVPVKQRRLVNMCTLLFYGIYLAFLYVFNFCRHPRKEYVDSTWWVCFIYLFIRSIIATNKTHVEPETTIHHAFDWTPVIVPLRFLHFEPTVLYGAWLNCCLRFHLIIQRFDKVNDVTTLNKRAIEMMHNARTTYANETNAPTGRTCKRVVTHHG
jgi:hypothetical protein